MKLNRIEKILMNNPIRARRQRRHEAPLLRRLGGTVDGGDVLEVGCGRGVGTEIILAQFGTAHVRAIDLDPDMVEKARRRLARFVPDRVELSVGDVTAIDAEDEAFDAVFDFGIIHHVPNWQGAITEIRRVLRPGGRFFFHELTRRILDTWAARTFTDHPRENRFSGEEFAAELALRGIALGDRWEERHSGRFIFGVGVATG